VISVGLGFRAGSSLEELERALGAALAAREKSVGEIERICVPDFKQADANLGLLIARLGKPLVPCSPAALRACPLPTLTQSSELLRRFGVGSTSEACALLGALAQGKQARLLGPRLVAGSVTCALAISEPSS